MTDQDIFAASPEHEIVTIRTVPYPIDLAFAAWTEPEHLKSWWGPAGFTNTFHDFDLRPGGRWRFTMHGPETGHYENDCEFTRIERPVLLAWKRHSKPLFQVATSFKAVSERETEVIFRQIFETVEECEKLRKYVVDKNEENFDRLEEELGKMEI